MATWNKPVILLMVPALYSYVHTAALNRKGVGQEVQKWISGGRLHKCDNNIRAADPVYGLTFYDCSS